LDLRVEANGQTLASFSDVAVNPPVVRLDITVPAQAQANPQTAEKSGTLDIVLAPGNAPITVINFLRHVEEGYYPGTVFHRVYPGFMIQAGGLTYASNAYANKQAIFPPIPLERTTVTGLSNIQFSVAMARTSAVNSATSQFFISVEDNSATLDADGSQAVDPGNGYAVFGELTASSRAESQQTIDLLNAILAVPKSPSGEGTQPLNPPVITGATRIR
jgi:cyclophilin family peptidyl-prolyl cis-trans isomerase